MRKFAKYLLFLLLLTSAAMVLLDWAYTAIYERSIPRNKLEYILKLKGQRYDAVFLGSSRVANHIDAALFNKLSHRKGINLGVEGAGLNDNLLQLKLLLHANEVKTLYLQIDTNLESTEPSNISKAEAMPFIKNEIIKAHIEKYDPDFAKLYYIPFYRFAVNDAKIGFREVLFSAIGKKPGTDPSIGYTPKFGNNLVGVTPTKMGKIDKLRPNAILDEIRNICKIHHTRLILFITPCCSKVDNKEYLAKLRTVAPDVLDLTKGYDDSLFFNCGHLNDQGAKILTQRLYEDTKAQLN